jgi:hypothetical protein
MCQRTEHRARKLEMIINEVIVLKRTSEKIGDLYDDSEFRYRH